mmetsp:Transcript_8837/g.25720  ORF Transcript_8837/g.25720 Transcript_8837/m.25720 type:complete len:233 (-) Transcript_8837:102-800(-)
MHVYKPILIPFSVLHREFRPSFSRSLRCRRIRPAVWVSVHSLREWNLARDDVLLRSSNHPIDRFGFVLQPPGPCKNLALLSKLWKLFSNQAFCALKNLRPLRGVSVSLQFVPLPPFVDRLSKLHERRRVLFVWKRDKVPTVPPLDELGTGFPDEHSLFSRVVEVRHRRHALFQRRRCLCRRLSSSSLWRHHQNHSGCIIIASLKNASPPPPPKSRRRRDFAMIEEKRRRGGT